MLKSAHIVIIPAIAIVNSVFSNQSLAKESMLTLQAGTVVEVKARTSGTYPLKSLDENSLELIVTSPLTSNDGKYVIIESGTKMIGRLSREKKQVTIVVDRILANNKLQSFPAVSAQPLSIKKVSKGSFNQRNDIKNQAVTAIDDVVDGDRNVVRKVSKSVGSIFGSNKTRVVDINTSQTYLLELKEQVTLPAVVRKIEKPVTASKSNATPNYTKLPSREQQEFLASMNNIKSDGDAALNAVDYCKKNASSFVRNDPTHLTTATTQCASLTHANLSALRRVGLVPNEYDLNSGNDFNRFVTTAHSMIMNDEEVKRQYKQANLGFSSSTIDTIVQGSIRAYLLLDHGVASTTF